MIMVMVVGWMIYEKNDHFVSSTFLPQEGLGEVSLLDPVNDEFKERHGPYSKSENVFYKELLRFSPFHVGTNDDDRIVYLQANDNNMATHKGVTIGTQIEKVKNLYGEDFYSRTEQGMPIIGYIDRESNITVQFWHYQGKVMHIRMYYNR